MTDLRASQFGPSALATPANALTVIRLLLTIPLLSMVAGDGASWVALELWIVLCLTDWIDGIVARRHGTTRSGAFLDPLADKVLVLGVAFVLVAEGAVWWLPVTVIAVRELGIQAFRSYWARRGLAVPATSLAKAKTVVQQVALGLFLMPPSAEDATWLGNGLLWVAVVLTVVTGVQYVGAGSRMATTAGSR
ncbi:MAG TPA: CDP-diacylglycerol--glycerol-3-phosphate 3-phosphatidyltransferase [Acidimicrobiales bacterium]|nr:CDP-diacylglycerol--glycerol-3-phosphate 3-phosphatidyltransferase [Acidimicrobiales bacterium]